MVKPRAFGIALAALGMAAVAGGFFLSEGFTPYLGPGWNLKHMDVVLFDRMEESFMGVEAFRARYPAYGDMDGEELSLRLREKYFSGMPLNEYRRHFLGAEASPAGGKAGGDPLGIRGEVEKLKITDPFSREVMRSDAIDYGMVKLDRKRAAFPFRYVLIAGAALALAGALAAIRLGKKKV